MGAIFGVLGCVPESEVKEMGRRLAHRGRSCRITRVDENMFLAAVGDSHDDSLLQEQERCLVCDATIYNVVDLHRRLVEWNAKNPLSDDPCSLINELYRVRGSSGIEEIDGDFAFVLIDRPKRQVIFGRDFFGVAPLYYVELAGGGLAFASEYKALLALSPVSVEVDLDMVQYLQCAKRLPLGRTLLRHVRAVLPGCVTQFDTNGKELSRHSFAPLKCNVEIHSESEAIELVRSRLTEAVRRRSQDFDKIGIALSGGIDSISMAFLFRHLYPDKEIHTFTSGSGAEDHEIATAARVAKKIGSVHHEVITPPALLRDGLAELVWHLEDPYSRSEALQLYEIGRSAANHFGVLFCAIGPDGLFAGMPKYKILWLMTRFPPLRHSLGEFYNLTQLGLRPRSLLGRLMDWAKFRGSLPDVPRIRGASGLAQPIQFPPAGPDFLNRTMADGFQKGVCQSIQKFERGFAAWGVRYRSPFFDPKLVRSAYTISDTLKIKNGVQKYIFRRALAGIVSDEFLNIPKFPQRMKYDLAFSETLDRIADRWLSRERIERRGFFRQAEIARLRRRNLGEAYGDEWGMRIWTAVATEIWAEIFLDRRGAPLAEALEALLPA
jgi:asparagine synthase (glutamine-hydrolysing)